VRSIVRVVQACLIGSILFSTSWSAALGDGARVGADSTGGLKALSDRLGQAQLVVDNDAALKLRLALLDHAARGARARIATFTFEDGEATRALVEHMCSAVARGVSVELAVDSKSGGILGESNPFNDRPEVVEAERSLMKLANCGAKVFIHNYTTEYVTLLNKRLPNIMAPEARSGDDVGLIEINERLSEIRMRLAARLNATLDQSGVGARVDLLLEQIQALAIDVGALVGMSSLLSDQEPSNASGTPLPLDLAAERLNVNYRRLLDNAFWAQFNPGDRAGNAKKMRLLTQAIVAALEDDELLKLVREKIRIYNRLNHRKLFIVQDPSASGDDCAIIGGRNLGDHYLTSGPGAFRDGDVFFCRRQVPTLDPFLRQANKSFEELVPGRGQDVSDPILHAQRSNVLIRLEPKETTVGPIVPAVKLEGSIGDPLGEIDHPVLLRAAWNPKSDQIRQELLSAIRRERKELYIETAYAQFDESIRDAIEAAMRERKVKVRLVTNSLFLSDRASKLIRLWMAKWNEQMAQKYPHLFQLGYASLASGHMIHFKGAAFRCQAALAGGASFREYIVGSHNFHPRSGYSDKEHAIEWRVATPDCRDPQSDLLTSRIHYYEHAQNAAKPGEPVLIRYTTLSSEVIHVARDTSNPNSQVAQAIERAMHEDDAEASRLSSREKLDLIQELLDQGGLRDLVGMLF
jgi:phosphatidylserine/phosphatidylglycerophosphate/cardiolipin synthase-like enzyme